MKIMNGRVLKTEKAVLGFSCVLNSLPFSGYGHQDRTCEIMSGCFSMEAKRESVDVALLRFLPFFNRSGGNLCD